MDYCRFHDHCNGALASVEEAGNWSKEAGRGKFRPDSTERDSASLSVFEKGSEQNPATRAQSSFVDMARAS